MGAPIFHEREKKKRKKERKKNPCPNSMSRKKDFEGHSFSRLFKRASQSTEGHYMLKNSGNFKGTKAIGRGTKH